MERAWVCDDSGCWFQGIAGSPDYYAKAVKVR
jgi:hypothetical protein